MLLYLPCADRAMLRIDIRLITASRFAVEVHVANEKLKMTL
jgi:hypothetical protein